MSISFWISASATVSFFFPLEQLANRYRYKMRRVDLTLTRCIVLRVEVDGMNLEWQCRVHVITQGICKVCDTQTLFLDAVNMIDDTKAKLNTPFRG